MGYCQTLKVLGEPVQPPSVDVVEFGFGEVDWENTAFTDPCEVNLSDSKNWKEAVFVRYTVNNIINDKTVRFFVSYNRPDGSIAKWQFTQVVHSTHNGSFMDIYGYNLTLLYNMIGDYRNLTVSAAFD